MENPTVKRSTISLILPSSTMDSSIEQTETFDPSSLFNGTKQSSLLRLNEQNNKHVFINGEQNLLSQDLNSTCIYWILYTIIRLIFMTLLTCIIGIFIFVLIFYAIDIHWLEQPIINITPWWWRSNNNNVAKNNTNLTTFDSDMISTTQTINYDNEY
ncbi:unnamed protein product [Rotaria magnacalcarata]|uniref:Uncharacterized protein n=1 Tax=Rotaria magnacalcarata TaxID=392030 RepID=A0A819AF86_9BILA|nr:unnamed protein product [Rotaria magnacalcarata]CAF1678191.1 unnamed protein product [Rotaria magnacalcarata]CAF1926177.1 unnamed protein product [Rotaria magnacalcarata]CAF2029132.1 unnamed protein product [Rotaria magnacalcarata]CAF2095395.1 unnamed protein product [Rotaria magnacalcarata]